MFKWGLLGREFGNAKPITGVRYPLDLELSPSPEASPVAKAIGDKTTDKQVRFVKNQI
jgi:hypothetical protein